MKLTWSPSGGKKEDVEADECDLGGNGGVVVLTLSACGDTDNTNDEFADQHAKSAPNENCAATETLNDVEGNRSGAHIDKGGNKTDEEGVLDCLQLLEEGSTEVEDEVYTGPLLHHLEGGAENGPAKVGRGVKESTLKAVIPGSEIAVLRDNRKLVLVISDDLSEFLLNIFGALRFTTETGQDMGGFVEVTLLDEITGRLGKEEEASSKNDSPEHLDGDWDTIRTSIVSVLGAIIDARSEQDTDCDAELVTWDAIRNFLVMVVSSERRYLGRAREYHEYWRERKKRCPMFLT